MRLVLLRHGETTMGRGVFLGSRHDPGLSETGRRQSEDAALALRGRRIAAVRVSPLRRARETAAIVAPDREHVVDARLRELDFGIVSGLSWAEIEARLPAVAAAWRSDGVPAPPGGEAPVALWQRVSAAVLDATSAAGAGDDLLIVAHGGTLRAIMAAARGLPMQLASRIRPAHARLRTQRVTPLATARWRAARDRDPG